MSAIILKLAGVELSDADVLASDDAGTPKRVWIQLAKPGAFKGHAAGPFELSDATFGEILRNFRATENRAIPIDYEHASEADPSSGNIPIVGAPAQGWIVDLKVEGSKLFGLVEWGTQAREYITTGKYRYISPAIRFGARDRVTGAPIGARLTSAGLTNQPFLDGMQRLAASDTLAAGADSQSGNDAAGDNTMDFEKLLIAEKEKTASLSEKVGGLTAAAADKDAKIAELTLTLKDATAKAADAEAKLAALTAKQAERDEADAKAAVELAFETYKDAKKLSEKDKDAMLVVLKASPDAFKQLYPTVSPSKAHLLRNVANEKQNPAPATKLDGTERTVTMDFKPLVDTYMSQGIPYLVAVDKAWKTLHGGKR